MKKRRTSVLPVICAIVLTAALSSTATALYLMGGFGGEKTPLRKFARLETMRQILDDEYYLEVDDELLFDGALKGMLAALNDPYTYYITPAEAQARTQSENQSYYGLGMTVQLTESDGLAVVAVTEGTPAYKADVRVGDHITAVDGTNVTGMEFEEAVALIRSEEASEVVLTIDREGETLERTLNREVIPISNISMTTLEGDIGYIGITQFAGSDVEDFRSAVETLIGEGVTGLIIDVRGNPGGYLDHVTQIADMLLPEGLIVYTQDRVGRRSDHYSDAEMYDIPLCVLVDGNSASASEILAAAIRDNGRGAVIGTQTFGKGIVQSVYSFEDDGAAMQFTSSTYYTPSGVCIHGTGVTPDIVEEDPDRQLQTAIDVLKGTGASAVE